MYSNSVQISSHTIPPDRLRMAVIGRHVRLPDATAALVAELAFGAARREMVDGLPSSRARLAASGVGGTRG